jgi:UDP:flavonoid glycosyltransferase YjiC (YdhE family)
LRPAAAVTSSGTAPRLACEAAAVPQLHLMHYLPLSRYGHVPSVVWGRRWRDARSPRRLVRATRARLVRRRRGGVRRATTEVIDEVRSDLGLPPSGEGSYGRCRDTVVAITSTPLLDPARGLPPHWRYVGPVPWSFPTTALAGSAAASERVWPDRPLVYVSQGSTGSAELLRRAVSELAEEPIEILATTARLMDPKELERTSPTVRAEPFLPGKACVEAADVAVISGGHLTAVEALLAGTPVVTLPFRGDQYVNASRAERLGVGRAVWPNASRPGDIRAAVRRVLSRPSYRRRACEVARRLRDDAWNGARNAADLVEGLTR